MQTQHTDEGSHAHEGSQVHEGNHAHEHGYSSNKSELMKRLRRAEGQVGGIYRMIENDEYCIDVITQITAASKALEKVALSLLDDHLGHCVSAAAAQGGEVAAAKLKEASDAVARLVR